MPWMPELQRDTRTAAEIFAYARTEGRLDVPRSLCDFSRILVTRVLAPIDHRSAQEIFAAAGIDMHGKPANVPTPKRTKRRPAAAMQYPLPERSAG
jgi:hypothetical protein